MAYVVRRLCLALACCIATAPDGATQDKKRIDDTVKRLESKLSALEGYLQSIEKGQSNPATLEQMVAQADQRQSELALRAAQLEKSLADAQASAQKSAAQHQKTIADMAERNATALAMIETLEGELKRVSALLDRQEARAAGLENEKNELATNLDAARTSLASEQARSADLTRELATARSTQSDLEGRTGELSKQLEQAEATSAQREASHAEAVASLTASRDRSEEERVAFRSKLAEVESHLGELQRQAEQLRTERDQLTSSLAHTKIALAEERDRAAEFQRTLESAQDLHRELATREQQLRQRLEAIGEQAEREIASHQDTISTLTNEREQAGVELASLQAKLAEAETRGSELAARTDDIAKERDEIAGRLQAVEASLAEERASAASARDGLRAAEQLYGDLEAREQNLRQRLDALEASYAEIAEVREAELGNLTAEANQLRQQLADAQGANEQLRRQLDRDTDAPAQPAAPAAPQPIPQNAPNGGVHVHNTEGGTVIVQIGDGTIQFEGHELEGEEHTHHATPNGDHHAGDRTGPGAGAPDASGNLRLPLRAIRGGGESNSERQTESRPRGKINI